MAGQQHSKNKNSTASSGQLRIIGGTWRGPKLSVTQTEGIRPTPNRVRETLFNWLIADVYGAKCLDLFAGTGALGLEALSRGAKSCQFIEQSVVACRQLQNQLRQLAVEPVQLENFEAVSWLRRPPNTQFNIVFLDPPYHQGLVDRCCKLLIEQHWLTENAAIYIEMASDEAPPSLQDHWELHREKVAGQVCYRLYYQQL
jgi:16S rRNA (guanine966-N2)-methyltransferase